MTREEAIKLLKQYQGYEPMFPDGETLKHAFDLTDETVDTLLSALRHVSREQVEKVWRKCEWCNGEHSNNGEITAYAEVECEGCDAGDNCPNAHSSDDPCYGMVDRALPVNFCPVCGAPMTDEAVEMVMRRLDVLYASDT